FSEPVFDTFVATTRDAPSAAALFRLCCEVYPAGIPVVAVVPSPASAVVYITSSPARNVGTAPWLRLALPVENVQTPPKPRYRSTSCRASADTHHFSLGDPAGCNASPPSVPSAIRTSSPAINVVLTLVDAIKDHPW